MTGILWFGLIQLIGAAYCFATDDHNSGMAFLICGGFWWIIGLLERAGKEFLAANGDTKDKEPPIQ